MAGVQSLVDLSLVDIHKGTLILCGHVLGFVDTVVDDEEIERKETAISDRRDLEESMAGYRAGVSALRIHSA